MAGDALRLRKGPGAQRHHRQPPLEWRNFRYAHRAARAATWNVAEVSTACRTQADGLPAYRAAIASALAMASAAYPDAEAARFVNKAYLEFFLPFWWEHVLLRSALDEDKAAAEVKLILASPAPAPAVPAAAPAPPPFPTPAPPPAPQPHHGAPPPYFREGYLFF